MKYVLTYESPASVDMALIAEHFPAHRARWATFQEQGTLLLIGPMADPRDGAMAVFTTEEAARAFAESDPFVLNGVVSSWKINAWNEVLLAPI